MKHFSRWSILHFQGTRRLPTFMNRLLWQTPWEACLCGGPPALCGSHCGCRLWEIHAHPPVCDQPAQRGILFLYLSDSKLTPRWFYKGMLDQLGIESKFYRGDAKRQLQKEVEIIRGVQKKKVVCILDEAHLLGEGNN